jgi:hypothetical protein
VFLLHTTEDKGLELESCKRVVEFILMSHTIEGDEGTKGSFERDAANMRMAGNARNMQVSIDSPASRPRQTAGTNFLLTNVPSKGSGEERGGVTVAWGPRTGLGVRDRQYPPARMAIPGLQLAKAAYVSPPTSVLARYLLLYCIVLFLCRVLCTRLPLPHWLRV